MRFRSTTRIGGLGARNRETRRERQRGQTLPDRRQATEGRVIAAILMTAGVGVFGTFAAYLASLFVAPTARKEEEAS